MNMSSESFPTEEIHLVFFDEPDIPSWITPPERIVGVYSFSRAAGSVWELPLHRRGVLTSKGWVPSVESGVLRTISKFGGHDGLSDPGKYDVNSFSSVETFAINKKRRIVEDPRTVRQNLTGPGQIIDELKAGKRWHAIEYEAKYGPVDYYIPEEFGPDEVAQYLSGFVKPVIEHVHNRLGEDMEPEDGLEAVMNHYGIDKAAAKRAIMHDLDML